jgi:hypothetical protein
MWTLVRSRTATTWRLRENVNGVRLVRAARGAISFQDDLPYYTTLPVRGLHTCTIENPEFMIPFKYDPPQQLVFLKLSGQCFTITREIRYPGCEASLRTLAVKRVWLSENFKFDGRNIASNCASLRLSRL